MQKRGDLSHVQKGITIGFGAKDGHIFETLEFLNCLRATVIKVCKIDKIDFWKISDWKIVVILEP